MVLVIAGAFGAYYYWPGGDSPRDGAAGVLTETADKIKTNATDAKSSATGVVKKRLENPDAPAPGPAGMTAALAESIGPSPITTPVAPALAQQRLKEGLELYARNKDILQARTLLNQAYMFGRLSEPQAISCRKALENIAARTVLRRDNYVNPKDPYTLSHTFQSGDRLLSRRDSGGYVTVRGVIARRGLNVPHSIIVWANGLDSATQFKAGVSYKLLKGPFHVVVYKSKFAADIYLRDLFLLRAPICIGAPETPTPEGYFRVVAWRGKTTNSTYYPPAETGRPNIAISPGQGDYPLGPRGLNIKIEGIPQLGTNIRASQSYAIHGTADPSSIGQALSRGCIRLDGDDMQFLYNALQDYAAPDDKRATWHRWSTITIKK